MLEKSRVEDQSKCIPMYTAAAEAYCALLPLSIAYMMGVCMPKSGRSGQVPQSGLGARRCVKRLKSKVPPATEESSITTDDSFPRALGQLIEA